MAEQKAEAYTGAVRVTAPYVTLKVKDSAGADVISGFYEGGIVENVEAESLQHHLDNEMVEKVSVDKEGKVTAAKPKAKASEPKTPPSGEVPGGNANREEWAQYAKTKGATEDELKDPSEGGLGRDELRAKYGA